MLDSVARRCWFVLLGLLICVGSGAAADAVDPAALARARSELLQGNTAGAVQMLQDMQVDAPDSPIIHFNLGAAHERAAQDAKGRGETGEAQAQFNAAQRAFEAAAQAGDDSLRADATYNAGNMLAEQAHLLRQAEQTAAAAQVYQRAIETYDRALDMAPGHAEALHNRGHARLNMKQLLLEEPPPPPEPQDQPEGGEQDDPGEDEEQPQPEPDGEQDDAADPDAQDPEPGEPDDGEDEEGTDQEPDPSQQPAPPPVDDSPEMEPQDLPLQEFEAILDNLQDIDDEEQRNMRRDPRGQTIVREWW